MEFKKTFHENLTDMLENVVSSKDLAKQCNVSDVTVFYWRKKKYLPNLKNMITIANIADCSIDYFIGSTKYKSFNKVRDEIIFTTRLSELINSKKISKLKIAEAMKISDETMRKWFRGYSPTLEMLVILSEYFEVAIEYLIGRTDDKWL